MLVLLGRLDRLQVTDSPELRAGNPSSAFLGVIEKPEINRVHAQFLA